MDGKKYVSDKYGCLYGLVVYDGIRRRIMGTVPLLLPHPIIHLYCKIDKIRKKGVIV